MLGHLESQLVSRGVHANLALAPRHHCRQCSRVRVQCLEVLLGSYAGLDVTVEAAHDHLLRLSCLAREPVRLGALSVGHGLIVLVERVILLLLDVVDGAEEHQRPRLCILL